MKELPDVISVDKQEQQIILTLHIQADLPFFAGHFPAHPVLPGVVQLRWAEELARKYGLTQGEFLRVEKLKFQRIIGKGFTVTLLLRYSGDNCISFQYDSEHGRHSSGKLVFK